VASVIGDAHEEVQKMLQPFLNTPVRITYTNGGTALVFDKVIRTVNDTPNSSLMAFNDGAILFEGNIEIKLSGELLTIKQNGGCLSLVRWIDLPKQFRPYSKEIAELVGRGSV